MLVHIYIMFVLRGLKVNTFSINKDDFRLISPQEVSSARGALSWLLVREITGSTL